MFKGKRLWLFPILLLLALLVFAACEAEEVVVVTPTPTPTPAVDISGESVDVLGIWGEDPELTNFRALVAPWEADTGASMDFTGTRDITPLLTTRVEGGNPPDVALPAEIGLFQDFARAGQLIPLSECQGLEEKVRAEYPQGFIDLGTVDGVLYGFFMKADTKATVWYKPKFFDEQGFTPLTAASTFDDLITLSNDILAAGFTPWSNGQFANGGTGFPGTDTIQQILLNEAGGDVYDGVIDGSVPFADPRVKDAWEKFGQLALTAGYVVQGDAEGINATSFIDATFPPYQSPPTSAMNHLGGFASGFIADQFPASVPGEDFAFFPWPGGAVTGGANVAYAFNSDPATCSFLTHIASAEAQQIWVAAGGFTSVNTGVSLDAYPDPISRAQAEQLTAAEVFRFDLDDAIGGALQVAFFTGITDYLANPGNLDDILAGIEATR